MKILIVGATGTLGREITKLSKEKGYDVVPASRSSEHPINIDDPQSISEYFNKNSDFDAIICAAGNASFGSFRDMNDEQIKLGVDSKLLGQVNLVRKGIDNLNSGGVIILTGGILAYSPWPQTSNIAMVNAGLEGFVKAASLELDDDKRVVIVHPPLLRETAEAMSMDSSLWPSAGTVAESYVDCLVNTENGTPIFVKGYVPDHMKSEMI